MQFSIKAVQPGRAKTGCAVVGVFESRKLSLPASRIDEVAQGYLAAIVRRGDMGGKSGSTLLLHNVPGVASERVLLVGLGKESDFGARAYREAIAAAVRTLNGTGTRDVELHLT
ncbi:MAG TPA: M17 family peptidase N-terminal domain-containing protein, partial [Burkholderiales bacterium]|nr:M17 family peptidase N-terminal domain-containing protein [Burkholderiales bacterium]